jgi:2,3-dihydroxybenzoate decarboxylase
MRGTIAIEEAIIDPAGVPSLAQWQRILSPSSNPTGPNIHEERLLDIHDERLKQMDEEGVEYMLLSLTSPGCQGEPDPAKAEDIARVANDYLAAEVAKNPKRFGALAALSMHSAEAAAKELRRCVERLGMFGGLVNDFQSNGSDGAAKKFYDAGEYWPFWAEVERLRVPIYFHPRYPIGQDLGSGTRYGERAHLLGAGVQFHLDLSWHLYAVISSGIFDRYPGAQIVAGHLGEK